MDQKIGRVGRYLMRRRSISGTRTYALLTIVMVRSTNVKAEEAEKAIQKAIAGVKDRTYRRIDQAAKELGVSKATLHRRLKGGKSQSEAQAQHQRLTPQEERAITTWICMSTAGGTRTNHSQTNYTSASGIYDPSVCESI